MKKAILLLSAILFLSANTHAQTFLNIGNSDGFEIFAPKGDANVRIGNAVLARVVEVNAERQLGFAWVVLAACDGSWVSTPIQSTIKTLELVTPQIIYKYSKETDLPIPYQSAFFVPTKQQNLQYVKAISRNAAALCKTAEKEPRNILIPVVRTEKDSTTDSSTAILSGTSIWSKNTIELWLRVSDFKQVPYLDEKGNEMENQGRKITRPEATGAMQKIRAIINCKDRLLTYSELIEYPNSNAAPKRTSFPRDPLERNSVIPGSSGEALLDSVCTLYGTKEGR